ncbi:cysteine-rich motor neuron 1 protein-like isoform X1 [Euwallacea similis]|uniref:cysteine-rich motor neuron 1 protein-like isoform X1 n=1 Tax=Euwallacea similis TaxID=1736056 RepID=UPI00344C3C66
MRILTIWVFLHLGFNKLVQAAPSIEACPPDSKLIDDACTCNPDSCVKPPCLSTLELVLNGTNEPGNCCPLYSCVGCKNETLIEGLCPCVPGATLNSRGVCECVDKERHLIDGECKCNPQQCELPEICDRKSVPTMVEDGCCRKTRCVPCPQDSESTNLETDELEDHCVCLPCINDCGLNKTVDIKKKGTGFPGNCCDLYECKPKVEEMDCVVGDIIYKNGDDWSTDYKQQCMCKNGFSLCHSKVEEPPLQNCWDEAVMYRHNDTWLKDRGCTICTCLNGELKCISHYCDFKESQIKNNGTASCTKDNRLYNHLENWTEVDECSECFCENGEITCTSRPCEDPKESSNVGECQTLFNCNKQCANGLRINKKGCEICKCNPSKVSPELLTKYNITLGELLNILEDYSKSRTSTSASDESSSLEGSTSTTTERVTPMPTVVIIRRNGNDQKAAIRETVITPAFLPKDDSSFWIIIIVIAISIVIIICVGLGVYFYRNKRKYSVTPSRGSYHSVLNTTSDNNNTIKKNSIKFENK